jgi:hypothetical protein
MRKFFGPFDRVKSRIDCSKASSYLLFPICFTKKNTIDFRVYLFFLIRRKKLQNFLGFRKKSHSTGPKISHIFTNTTNFYSRILKLEKNCQFNSNSKKFTLPKTPTKRSFSKQHQAISIMLYKYPLCYKPNSAKIPQISSTAIGERAST